MNKVIKVLRQIKNFIIQLALSIKEGYKAGLAKAYTKLLVYSYLQRQLQIRNLTYPLPFKHTEEDRLNKLKVTTTGLHSLLPFHSRYFYSILISIDNPKLENFKTCIDSVLNQSTSQIEIIIGKPSFLSQELENFLQKCESENPNKFILHANNDLNQLAANSKGSYLLVMGAEDWLRPDFFFRFEQTLRLFSDPENIVLYCNTNKINRKNFFIPLSENYQPEEIHFPYVFSTFSQEGLLFPKRLWNKVNGINALYHGVEYEDLILRLNLADAQFQHIPFALYSIREGKLSNKSQAKLIEVLQNYTDQKNLNWQWGPGFQSHTVRAIPPLNSEHAVQVIIPYKDQKALTLKCIQKLLQQTAVEFKITAIDNRSHDRSIAKEIGDLGVEVIYVDEPFNYSRLNNLAVKLTATARDCDLLLFLNNDVELESNALSEMVRWIDQPEIGMVGMRLNYPDGRLQHGGVSLDCRPDKKMHWMHVERLLDFEKMDITKKLGIFNAVTAACALVKKKDFIEVNGFDEIWYPIGYSDTNLAVKLSRIGLKCFYTPYALGIHHESVSRKTSHEEYENSWWLHNLLIKKKHGTLTKSSF